MDTVFEQLPWWAKSIDGVFIWSLPAAKSEYEKGREDGLKKAVDICEEYAKVTINPERARGAEILAKDIKREIERSEA